jgi:AcrR family transcriptional regulator
MARRVFSTDEILDAARSIVVERGPRAATVEAIAAAAGVPVGSIYHRFSSIDELLARVGLQPLESAVAVALAMYDHCLDEPQDTLLLDVLGRPALVASTSGLVHEQLQQVNDAIETLMAGLARSIFGRADRRSLDLVLLALVDLPRGFAHRRLSGGAVTPARRELLPGAVSAVLMRP